MGLMAGPESPPVMLLKRGRRVSTSIEMARNVLVRLRASAPAEAAIFAIWAMDVTLGESFTMSGRADDAFAVPTRYSSEPQSEPNAIPPACTLGQDTFSS